MVLVTKTKHKVSHSGRRRSGQHHHKNDHYIKSYWPYLPIGLIVALGLTFNGFLTTMHRSVLGYATATSISGLLQGTNVQRGTNGLGGLAINATLNAAAQAKANDMAARNYWSHNTPEGNAPWIFFTNAGYNYLTAGENLAYGFDSSDSTITAWMNSPEHRDNILNTTYLEVGFGIANAADYQGAGPETIVVAMYGSSQHQAPVAAAPAAPSKPASSAPAPAVTTPAPAAPAAEPPAAPKETNATPTAVAGSKNKQPQVVATKNVARIQLLTNGAAPWSMFAVSAIAAISICIFFLRHGLLWHRVLVRGEAFVHKHPFMDIALVTVGVIGFILSRSAGVIH